MAAFVAALLIQASDRTPWALAILGDRYDRPLPVIAAAVVAIATANALGAIAGSLMAPILTPNAKALLVAVALGSAGVSALFKPKVPDRFAGSRAGAFLTVLIGVLAMAMGDRTQFATAALATQTPWPAFAAVGATLGSLVVVIPAMAAGEASYRSLPLRPIRIAVAAMLIVTALVLAAGALRLV